MIGTKTEREAKDRALALGLLVAALMAACLLLAAKPAYAKTFGVNSTKDREDERPGNGRCSTGVRIVHKDGGIESECTLRAAIQEANATTQADTINFGILRRRGTNCTTAKLCTISPATPLPQVTRPTTINGYSQPGSSPNTATTGTNAVLKIVLDGSNAGSSATGLYVTGTNTTIKGLVINRFDTGVILFPEGGQPNPVRNKLEGSFIGTDATGTTALPNRTGVFPTGVATGTNELVGGGTLAARNLISGNQWNVNLFDRATVEGNLIGTKRDGTTGVWGPDVCRGDTGVLVEGSNNTITRNTIAFNGFNGVGVRGADATGNRILGNSIFDNCLLGIDLDGNFAANANDAGDPDVGSNRLQNYPVISSALRFPDSTTTISGSLNSTPGTTFTVQFFSSPAADHSGFGEGKRFLGEIQATTNAGGDTSTFSFTTNRGAAPVGQFVTATATNNATGDTSEFSRAVRVESGLVDPDPSPG